jgi:hypothetical protein
MERESYEQTLKLQGHERWHAVVKYKARCSVVSLLVRDLDGGDL